jgi:hypothetical protein
MSRVAATDAQTSRSSSIHNDACESSRAGGQQILARAQAGQALAHLRGALPVRQQAVQLFDLGACERRLLRRTLQEHLRDPQALAHDHARGGAGDALGLRPFAEEARLAEAVRIGQVEVAGVELSDGRVLDVAREHVLAGVGERVALHPRRLDPVQPQAHRGALLGVPNEQRDALEIEAQGEIPEKVLEALRREHGVVQPAQQPIELLGVQIVHRALP